MENGANSINGRVLFEACAKAMLEGKGFRADPWLEQPDHALWEAAAANLPRVARPLEGRDIHEGICMVHGFTSKSWDELAPELRGDDDADAERLNARIGAVPTKPSSASNILSLFGKPFLHRALAPKKGQGQ